MTTADKHTAVGEWQERDDLPPVRRQHHDRETGLAHETLAKVTDRLVYTTWRDEDGNKYGCWRWESGL